MSSLADRVASRLKKVSISQAALARATRVSGASVADWVSGKTKTIKGENLLRAAQALQCTPYWLATGRGPETTEGAVSPDPVSREETVSYFTDKLVEEGKEILRLLDRPSRNEALQWLRGYAAGRKIEPWASAHGDSNKVAKKKSGRPRGRHPGS
jgi:transcriptional regulator with XRE-family HTH domain